MKKPLAILAIVSVLAVTLVFLIHDTRYSILFNRHSKSGIGHRASDSRRIVSLTPNLTEILFALGLDDKIVAVSSDSDWPAGAADKTKVGTFWQPDTEAIIAARPQLIVTETFEQQKAAADSLSRLGYEVLSLKLEKLDDLIAAIQKIGAAANCRQRADELTKNIKEQLNNQRLKNSSTDTVKVLWVVQTEPLRVVGRDTFINEMIELAGGENAIGPTIQQYPPISAEELLACQPQVIIQSAMGTAGIEKQQRAAEALWSRFETLPAVRNKRIYVVDSDTMLRLGPRLCQGIELIANLVQPNVLMQQRDARKDGE